MEQNCNFSGLWTGQWSLAYLSPPRLGFRRSLGRFWSGFQLPDLNPIENLSELEAIAHEEQAKIPQERCQKLLSGDASGLQQKELYQVLKMLVMKGWIILRLQELYVTFGETICYISQVELFTLSFICILEKAEMCTFNK